MVSFPQSPIYNTTYDTIVLIIQDAIEWTWFHLSNIIFNTVDLSEYFIWSLGGCHCLVEWDHFDAHHSDISQKKTIWKWCAILRFFKVFIRINYISPIFCCSHNVRQYWLIWRRGLFLKWQRRIALLPISKINSMVKLACWVDCLAWKWKWIPLHTACFSIINYGILVAATYQTLVKGVNMFGQQDNVRRNMDGCCLSATAYCSRFILACQSRGHGILTGSEATEHAQPVRSNRCDKSDFRSRFLEQNCRYVTRHDSNSVIRTGGHDCRQCRWNVTLLFRKLAELASGKW